jgi:hypothetical protein
MERTLNEGLRAAEESGWRFIGVGRASAHPTYEGVTVE